MKTIQLQNSPLVAFVDDADYDKVKDYRWLLSPKGYAIRYAGKSNERQQFRLHNDVIDCPSNSGVDHIDRNKLNCQRNNLRIATKSKQQQNRIQANNTTGYKGVTLNQRGQFRANIGFQRQVIHLGLFTTAEEAAYAYDEAARKLFGMDATTNFPLKTRVSV